MSDNYNDGRQWTDVICSDCGASCKVPFVPRDNSKVYCKTCYFQRKTKERCGVRSNQWKDVPDADNSSMKAILWGMPWTRMGGLHFV